MSKVIKFPIERTNCKPALPFSGNAKIVIFPGVRIERREYNLADRHAKVNHVGVRKAGTKNPNL